MPNIAIISASVRTGRKSHHVALHLKRSIEATENTVERIRKADGVIIVTPEYNGSFPASLKNVIDLLTEDWKGKPVSLCTASGGAFAGTQVMVELLFPLWKIKAWVVPSSMQVPKVQEAFGEDGSVLMDQEGWKRRTDVFLNDLGWAMEARRRMEA